MDKDDDARLVSECRKGDNEACGILLTRYQRPLYNAALRMLGNPEDARDVTQVTILKAFEKLGQYDGEHRFYSWIYRIGINESINFLQQRNRLTSIGEEEADESGGPQDSYRCQQIGAQVQEAIMSIGPEYRAVIVLRHFLECSYHDMSEILGIPEKTVKSRLYTAREQLRQRLDGEDTD